MFCGFNLIHERPINVNWYKIGKGIYDRHNAIGRTSLKSFTNADGSLNANKMTASWFPMIEADVFISHSHKNINQVITLAGWLMETFKLTSFIDSCIWGYADDLLELIDKEYCINANKPGEPGNKKTTYDYNKRNYSTSHVHMMLSTALTSMIDNTECLFFYNTPESICPGDVINATISPWIYSEISISRLIRQKSLSEHREVIKFAKRNVFAEAEKQLAVKYDVQLSHLFQLDNNKLANWKEIFNRDLTQKPLDILYKSFGKKII